MIYYPMAENSGVENVWDIITIQNLICSDFWEMMVARWLRLDYWKECRSVFFCAISKIERRQDIKILNIFVLLPF